MKKIIIGAAMLFTVSAYANPTVIDVSILKNFKETFPAAQNVQWNETETYCRVGFKENDIQSSIYYDLKGNIIRTLRYYSEKNLCPFIALKVKEKYTNKSIKGIVELQDENGLIYEIIMEDEKSTYILNSDATGNIYLKNKLKKV
ncbi:MAG: hypothetical protein ABIP35_01915 [Ginsengibacter sp.]